MPSTTLSSRNYYSEFAAQTSRGGSRNTTNGREPHQQDVVYESLREINLAYLMLAQRMAHEDKEWASYRLGLDSQTVEMIRKLSPTQILNIASADYFLFHPRCSGTNLYELLSQSEKSGGLKALHATMLLSQQPVANGQSGAHGQNGAANYPI